MLRQVQLQAGQLKLDPLQKHGELDALAIRS
jgi:hypothetical protein